MKRYLISSDGYIESLLTDENYSRILVTKTVESIQKAIDCWLKDNLFLYKPNSIRIKDKEVEFLIADNWDCDLESDYWWKTFYLHEIVEL